MFTVKATYRNETRRFTFPESVLFPAYEELRNQLCRVFAINANYYLSRLIFSPDASKPGRILVGKEVHSAEDYDSYVAPLRRLWPNPLLRFTIFDETQILHEASSVTSGRLSLYSTPTIPLPDVTSKSPSPVVSRPGCLLPPTSHSSMPPPPPPLRPYATSLFPPPPPPPIPSPTPSKSCSSQQCGTVGTTPCCSVTEGKADIKVLLSSFKHDLERILSRTFGAGYKETSMFVKESTSKVAVNLVLPPLQAESFVDTSAKASSRWCFVCRTNFTGIWYCCVKCPWHAVCSSCFSKSHSAHTLSFGPTHVIQQRSANHSAQVPVQIEREAKPCNSISGNHRPLGTASSGSVDESMRVVHHGVVCDSCNKTVTGIRHKCLDCSDYDLCTTCMESGATEQHNPFHEFFDIETPGRVYVHTVFGSDKHRSLGNPKQPPSSNHSPVVQQESAATPADAPICHPATCNLCDSAIVGERYKCVDCPDFDTCSACFRITTEQHPSHAFVKVIKPEDLMMRDPIPFRPVAHFAVCDSCRKSIRGPRYKCMHSGCPDFDLCSECEALPIPVHPLNHPMLKLKTSDTVIPTVYRVGQTQIIDEPARQKSAPVRNKFRSPALLSGSPLATRVKSPELPPVFVSDQVTNVTAEGQTYFAEELHSPLGSPTSEILRTAPSAATIVPSHPLVDDADTPGSPLSNLPPLDIHCQLWPRVNQEIVHLNTAEPPKFGDPTINPNEEVEPVIHKPLVAGESTPGIPPISSISQAGGHHGTWAVSAVSGAGSNVDDHRTPSPILSNVGESYGITQPLPAVGQQVTSITNSPQQSWSLNSALVRDANVPDGQIFPPGAEFVKGWHMMNNGSLPWPTTTEVQFVAGEMFASECNPALKARVGAVHPGEDFDIWTGDLKAPDVPGRYVGYWRLNDGQGSFFGSSVWIDVTVADHHSDQASELSLAASSMVMPTARPTDSVNASDELPVAPQPSLPSSQTVTDEVEDAGSEVSSVSLVSVPTSDDEDVEWEDTRTRSEPLEYVVLYDSNSEA